MKQHSQEEIDKLFRERYGDAQIAIPGEEELWQRIDNKKRKRQIPIWWMVFGGIVFTTAFLLSPFFTENNEDDLVSINEDISKVITGARSESTVSDIFISENLNENNEFHFKDNEVNEVETDIDKTIITNVESSSNVSKKSIEQVSSRYYNQVVAYDNSIAKNTKLQPIATKNKLANNNEDHLISKFSKLSLTLHKIVPNNVRDSIFVIALIDPIKFVDLQKRSIIT